MKMTFRIFMVIRIWMLLAEEKIGHFASFYASIGAVSLVRPRIDRWGGEILSCLRRCRK